MRIYPLGGALAYEVREGTNDLNVVYACTAHDEYGLADVDMTGKVVFDIGAHIGSLTMWVATRGARVVAVEPVPDNTYMIRVNAVLNGVQGRIHVVGCAAGTPGQLVPVRWNFRGNENAKHHAFIGNVGGLPPTDLEFDTLDVYSVSLHDLIVDFGPPDIVKLDCEGGEWALLREPEMAHVPLIVGEWHPTRQHGGGDVLAYLHRTHDVTLTGPVGGPGGFRAVLR